MHFNTPYRLDSFLNEEENIIRLIHHTFPLSFIKVTLETVTLSAVENLETTGFNSLLTIAWNVPEGEFTSKELPYNRIDLATLDSFSINAGSPISQLFDRLYLPYNEDSILEDYSVPGVVTLTASPTSLLYTGTVSGSVEAV